VGTLRQALVSWESDRSVACVRPPGLSEHPVGVIRRVLDYCPDEPLASPSTKLDFIAKADPELAVVLLRDMGSVDRALANAEWKAATVLAGSVIEALLLWALQQPAHERSVDASTAGRRLLSAAQRRGCTASMPSGALDYGDLNSYLDIATETAG